MTTTCPTLFAAHDSNLIRLPADVVKLRDARERAETHLRDLQPPPHWRNALDDLTDETVEAFIGGAAVPSVAPVLDAERASRAFDHDLDIGRNALAALDSRVAAALADQADALITDVLRPVFDTVVGELRDAYALLEPFEGAGTWALALAELKVRKAAANVEDQTHRYSVLCSAAAEVRKLVPPPEHDEDNEFVAFTDVHTVYPRRSRTGIAATAAPWTHEPDPQAWQLRNLTPWLPTAAEQDAKYREVYAEEIEAQRVRAEQHRAMALTFGHGH